MKLAFHLLTKGDQLWVQLLRLKYRWLNLHEDLVLRQRCSQVWRGVYMVWVTVHDHMHWQLGSGHSTSFWNEPWHNMDIVLASKVIEWAIIPNPTVSMADMVDDMGSGQ
ncbi:hypothetical protein V6N13_137672 [Hibiscus sabdariffa]